MDQKERAVNLYAKMFTKDKVLPYNERKKKAILSSINHCNKMIRMNVGNESEVAFWNNIKNYINKIDEELNNNSKKEEVR